VFLVSVVCCQVASGTGRSLVQTSLAECGVPEFDREASKMRRPRLTRSCRTVKEKVSQKLSLKMSFEDSTLLKPNAV
jgi:hypothetical protein